MLKLLRRIARDDIEASAGKLDGLIKRHEAYGEAIRALLVCLQDVAMDISEIDAAAYRDAIDRFRASFFEHKSASAFTPVLTARRKRSPVISSGRRNISKNAITNCAKSLISCPGPWRI